MSAVDIVTELVGMPLTADLARYGYRVGDRREVFGKDVYIIGRSYTQMEDYPEYCIDRVGSIRAIRSGSYVKTVRISQSGHELVNLKREGKTFTESRRNLVEKVFGKSIDEGDLKSEISLS